MFIRSVVCLNGMERKQLKNYVICFRKGQVSSDREWRQGLGCRETPGKDDGPMRGAKILPGDHWEVLSSETRVYRGEDKENQSSIFL